MKTLVFLFILVGCLLPKLGYSQSTIDYTFGYDASGNRVSRTFVMRKSAQLPKDSLSTASVIAKKQDILGEVFEKKQITIYPNPTKGLVIVEISLTTEDNAQISVYNIRGSLLLDYKNVSSRTNIDLSNEPTGTYLMKIFIGNKPTTWKILKQD
jgi:YD repeat-containing protein